MRSLRAARWCIAAVDRAEALSLAAALGFSPLAARVLMARGLGRPEQARRFLRPNLRDLHDPLLMRDMPRAVERLRVALARREPLLLYGDYDADGVTSVVMLHKAIELAGHRALTEIPHRLRDGYGLHAALLEGAANRGVRLLVSLDTGVRAASAIQQARRLGMDVIVVDHHLPDRELPPAFAVLNPRRSDCPYPEKNLCAAGVTLKLIQALLPALGWPAQRIEKLVRSFLKMAAIATVADVAPLTGENRIIVKHGLEGLRSVRNPGLRELLRLAGLAEGEPLTAEQVAFRLAPRLNAAGRMADAHGVVRLLLTDDEQYARQAAAELQDFNRQRQQTENDILRQVEEQCLRAPVSPEDAALVFSGPFHRGVLGIVAARLVERYHRPVFVLAELPAEGLAQGSGRSISSFHLLEALEAMPELFVHYGGHRQAAGVTLPLERLEEFRRRLNAYASARLTADDFRPSLDVDACCTLDELNERSAAELLQLAPFGHGNPAPLLLLPGVAVAGQPAVFKERHLRVALRQGNRTLVAKAWDFAPRAAELAAGARVDAVVRIEADAFATARGCPSWSAVLVDVRPAQMTV
ncbi:MAG: single-stranded-DNA-specific exonuclease RecJ [Bryobacterales bacterium]|nr:single-stranded-DNA-specific exonuclease RecJ [Bryobacteraceae bacterium]MDW8129970.1 single-stranded-DNA-specific exonuclease RecJ [Bryobacterales bacterium]